MTNDDQLKVAVAIRDASTADRAEDTLKYVRRARWCFVLSPRQALVACSPSSFSALTQAGAALFASCPALASKQVRNWPWVEICACWGICTDLSCVCAQTICRGIIDNMLRLCRRDDTDMATCGSFMAMLEGPGVYEHLSPAVVDALVEVGALMSGWALSRVQAK